MAHQDLDLQIGDIVTVGNINSLINGTYEVYSMPSGESTNVYMNKTDNSGFEGKFDFLHEDGLIATGFYHTDGLSPEDELYGNYNERIGAPGYNNDVFLWYDINQTVITPQPTQWYFSWNNGSQGIGPGYPPSSSQIDIRNNRYATATEEGAKRFRRLFSLGYV